MKVKVLSGLVLAVLPITALFFLHWPMIDVVLMIFSAVAAHEICCAVKIKNKAMMVASMVMAAAMPLLVTYREVSGPFIFPVMLGFTFLMIIFMFARFKTTPFTHLMYALVAAFVVPAAFGVIMLLRDSFLGYGHSLAVFFLLFAFFCAWLTDVFAYFSGVNFGKHKMCPSISPNKTWEGAIGGVLGTTLFNVAAALIFNTFFLESYRVSLIAIAVMSIPLCMIAMMGDLTASAIKRNENIKDFGKLIPGHGGAMDRFDSMMFVGPAFLAIIHVAELLGFALFRVVA